MREEAERIANRIAGELFRGWVERSSPVDRDPPHYSSPNSDMKRRDHRRKREAKGLVQTTIKYIIVL